MLAYLLAYLLTYSLSHSLTHLQAYSLTYEEDVLQVVGLEPHIDRLGREATVREGEPARVRGGVRVRDRFVRESLLGVEVRSGFRSGSGLWGQG